MTLKLVCIDDKQYLILNGYKFREVRQLADGRISWRCCSKLCSSTLKTDNGRRRTVESKINHNHKPQYFGPSGSPATTRKSSLPPTTHSTPNTSKNTIPFAAAASPPPTVPHPTTSTPTSRLPPRTQSSSPSNLSQLIAENFHLKQNIIELRNENKTLLEHSIESDQRLLQYTDQVFVAGTSASVTTLEPSEVELSDKEVETNLSKTYDLVKDTIKLKSNNEELKKQIGESTIQIKKLEQEIEHYKHTCEILQDEAKNMINTIKILEDENKIIQQKCATVGTSADSSKIHHKIATNNKFDVLSELSVEENETTFTAVTSKKSRFNKKQKNFPKKSKFEEKIHINKQSKFKPEIKTRIPHLKNITVVGDSHCRGLAALMRSTTRGVNITGVCKPGAGLLQIAPTSAPPVNHAYVILAGTNDLSAGGQDVIFRHLEGILKNCSESSKVLISPLLTRYDLPSDSPVHESVLLANNYIEELCHYHKGIEMLDLSHICRQHFTAHGLHLRDTGKRLLADSIVKSLARPPPFQSSSLQSHRRKITSRVVTAATTISSTPSNHESYAEAVSSCTSHSATNATSNQVFLGTPLLAPK